ncbi:hypothetical protein MVES1_001482 [Malassezia vespertilionis]|uniref:triacylglycerol lipase n=1 Tax=Malassezia vespertilionis TaxID=2020962 RepID=A0A2N1JD78_9BASI|nr:uncharacterized protein MVES1_001482 [Malassezia vespertilionis]PKI84482.1 hypothetical protein MVES_001396 [Malassezia vespertilionis]WFD06140.1 hypothetical protein MVES1_001482 [Malassezia vespertilionis]
MFGFININANAWQVLYRTNAGNTSTPMATVTTIIVPTYPRDDRLIMHAAIEDASAYKCRPSKTLRKELLPDAGSLIERIELLFLGTYLQQGWVVSVADYEGPMSAFGAGPIAGYSTLDAARATLNFKESGLDRKKTKIGSVGYSGGAIAVGWAAQLQGSYAPELNIAGWALGGTPANISDVVEKADQKFTAGLIVLGAAGVLAGYPELAPVAEKYLTPKGHAAVDYVRHNCAILASAPFAFDHIQSKKYIKGGLQLSEVPGVNKKIADLTMGANGLTPKAPVFMFHAVTDEFIPYAATKDAAQTWCDQGAQIEFTTEVLGLEHIATYIATFSRVFRFLEDRFQDKPLKYRKCSFKTIATPALNPIDDLELGGHVLEVAKTLLGLATGNPIKSEIIKAHSNNSF